MPGKFFISILCFSLFFSVSNGKMKECFEAANKYYASENYDSAAIFYDSLLKSGFESAEIYFNLGNVYFKTGNLPIAILNYERAKRLAPSDDDIDFNLKLANSRTVDKIEGIPPLFYRKLFTDLSRILRTDDWSMVSIISMWLTFIILAIYHVVTRKWLRKLCFFAILSFAVLSIGSFIFARSQMSELTSKNEGIVFSASVNIKSSPDESGTDLFVIHEGTKVTILDELGIWNKIKLANGNIGWLQKNTIEII